MCRAPISARTVTVGGLSENARPRQLACEAWEAELAEELEKLFEELYKRAAEGRSAPDLVNRIHALHDGGALDLYKRYSAVAAGTVAYGFANGVLDMETIDAELQRKLASQINAVRPGEVAPGTEKGAGKQWPSRRSRITNKHAFVLIGLEATDAMRVRARH
jgi:hypothetical protein